MNDSFAHAAANARADCPKCHGSGAYLYDHNHGTICDLCCQHDRGWWRLSESQQRANSGNAWCCGAGCGFTRADNPDAVN